jgi:hypothetical protein
LLKTYGPAPVPVIVVAGEPATVRAPGVTPVTAALNVTETDGSVATAVLRVGSSVCTVGAFE